MATQQSPTSETINAVESPASADLTGSQSPPYQVTFDVAAVLWPIAIFGIVWVLRKKLPEIIQNLVHRVEKFSFAGVELNLKEAPAFTPKLSSPALEIDLRNKAVATQVTDSNVQAFLDQLKDETLDSAEYAIINLGAGKDWLTSRLYIMAITLGHAKGLKVLAFIDNGKRFIGWANLEQVRWSFAKEYPYLEEAFTSAYNLILMGSLQHPKAVVCNATGRLGFESDPQEPQPNIDLIQEFLKLIQNSLLPGASSGEADPTWILIDPLSNTYEQASWLTSEKLKGILGKELHTKSICSDVITAQAREEQNARVLTATEEWIAITTDENRFQGLSNRNTLLKPTISQLCNPTN